jgi:hypothetical protein
MQSFRQRRQLKERVRLEVENKAAEALGSGKFPARSRNDILYENIGHGERNAMEGFSNISLHQATSQTNKNSQSTAIDETNTLDSTGSYDDMLNPRSWSVSSRWLYTFIIATTGCLVSFASSIAAPTVPQAMEEYGINQEVALLACATYFITFGLGTLIAAPLSEVFGRFVVATVRYHR